MASIKLIQPIIINFKNRLVWVVRVLSKTVGQWSIAKFIRILTRWRKKNSFSSCQSCIKFGAIKVLKSENIKSYYISENNVWNLKLFPIRSQVQSLVAGLGFNRRGTNQKLETMGKMVHIASDYIFIENRSP